MKNMKMDSKISKSAAVIVAHPDDETLWAGGTILSHPHGIGLLFVCAAEVIKTGPQVYKVLKS